VSAIRIEPSRRFVPLELSELWRARELFYFFTWRNLKIHFQQAVVGVGWIVLQPLLMMVLFTVFFGTLIGVTFWLLGFAIKALIIGGVAYLAIRVFAPDTARRLRERWSGTSIDRY